MSTEPLIWIDVETTGLLPYQEHVLEIAVIITDSDLNPVDDGLSIVIHQDDAHLENLVPPVQKMHTSSGLLDRVRASTTTVEEAERRVLDYINAYCPADVRPLMAGNSIRLDRGFIEAHMPLLDARLHYRQLDVSTVKEMVRLWAPEIKAKEPRKEFEHRALADIRESIAEMEFYRQQLL